MFSVDLDLHRDGGVANARDDGKKGQDVAHMNRLLEDKLVDRHGGHAAIHVARRQDCASHIHMGHHPAAKNIAIDIAIGRHWDDLEDQFLVGWKCHWRHDWG